MLKLATIIDNPGEPEVQTRYRDPQQLKQLGYTGIAVYESTALSGLETADVVASAELRRWVTAQIERVGRAIDDAHRAGLAVYFFYDALVLPTDLVERQAAALTCRHRPGVLCPASDHALDLSVQALRAMLERWPHAAGVVLRFGETDAARLPHLVGNDIYTPHCPRCSQLGRADRIVALLTRFHEIVVNEQSRQLIARAWNVRPNGMHDSVELARTVADRLPVAPAGEEDRLLLSFKFTHTDFWRYQRWNPASLVCGNRPILYELQCQREFEGKGGVPNWQVGLWRDGNPESRSDSEPAGLAHVADHVNLAGVWAWVRGGGWGGPFVSNETWIDANVFAAPLLADDPTIELAALAHRWVDERLRVADPAVRGVIVDILERSPEFVRDAFYIGPFARGRKDPWHPAADWIQDDLVDAQAAWRIVQRLPEPQLDRVVQEKRAAADAVSNARASLQRLAGERGDATVEQLVNTLTYTESLFEALRDLLHGLVAYRRYLKQHSGAAAETARQKLLAAQSHWNHHTQRHGSLPGTATAFREANFWELTQQILGELASST
ncbi:MAG: hypothetical protein WD009_04645 [Phycisphaeraceae bacterium]